MIFSLLVLSSPTFASSHTAFSFAQAALEQGHTIHRIFFYCDGVHHGSQLHCPLQDEQNLTELWQTLQDQHKLDIVVCTAASLKRGILDKVEADRHERDAYNLSPEFNLGGLGQLIDAAVHADRLLTFGG